ncbi:MAG: radical SAM protein [Flavobacteriales bacterium]|nr:radical SAM protein [Flavobacteriales bacterium]
MEAFYTIQGEGRYTGQAAFFIRLAGCDVGCVWCDVKESWETEGYPVRSAEELAQEAEEFPANIVVITGGEPCMYDLSALCASLHSRGKRVHLETSGAWPIRGTFDWICVSPKKFKAPLTEALKMADEYKVIVYNRSDFDWGLSHEKHLKDSCIRLLQPEWSKQQQMESLIVDFIKANPRWMLSLQTHKYIGIP